MVCGEKLKNTYKVFRTKNYIFFTDKLLSRVHIFLQDIRINCDNTTAFAYIKTRLEIFQRNAIGYEKKLETMYKN